MKVFRALMLLIGILAILMGLLWIGQGTGLVMWPASSFMLTERIWAIYGAVLAGLGLILIWLARRS